LHECIKQKRAALTDAKRGQIQSPHSLKALKNTDSAIQKKQESKNEWNV
jgi:hypothetical protein